MAKCTALANVLSARAGHIVDATVHGGTPTEVPCLRCLFAPWFLFGPWADPPPPPMQKNPNHLESPLNCLGCTPHRPGFRLSMRGVITGC